MELHSEDWTCFVLDGHDFFVGVGGGSEFIRKIFGDQGVITHCRKRRGDIFEDAFFVVCDE